MNRRAFILQTATLPLLRATPSQEDIKQFFKSRLEAPTVTIIKASSYYDGSGLPLKYNPLIVEAVNEFINKRNYDTNYNGLVQIFYDTLASMGKLRVIPEPVTVSLTLKFTTLNVAKYEAALIEAGRGNETEDPETWRKYIGNCKNLEITDLELNRK